jgi:release factor glutamine methyltransferase
MTLQQAYQLLLTQLFDIYATSEAEYIANLAVEHITGYDKTNRILNKTILLNKEQEEQLQTFAKQLYKATPIQYLLGYTWFYKHTFLVNNHVLIPRPETEELVALIIKENKGKAIHILDIGTGSGCIAISLQHALHHATVTAIDVSEQALLVAEQNARKMGVSINFKQINFLEQHEWPSLDKYDVIVSNPPYIKQSEAADLHKNVVEHEPDIALFVPDNDALIFYRYIADFAKKHLKNEGLVYVEINQNLAKETLAVFSENYKEVMILQDISGNNRFVKALKY